MNGKGGEEEGRGEGEGRGEEGRTSSGVAVSCTSRCSAQKSPSPRAVRVQAGTRHERLPPCCRSKKREGHKNTQGQRGTTRKGRASISAFVCDKTKMMKLPRIFSEMMRSSLSGALRNCEKGRVDAPLCRIRRRCVRCGCTAGRSSVGPPHGRCTGPRSPAPPRCSPRTSSAGHRRAAHTTERAGVRTTRWLKSMGLAGVMRTFRWSGVIALSGSRLLVDRCKEMCVWVMPHLLAEAAALVSARASWEGAHASWPHALPLRAAPLAICRAVLRTLHTPHDTHKWSIHRGLHDWLLIGGLMKGANGKKTQQNMPSMSHTTPGHPQRSASFLQAAISLTP